MGHVYKILSNATLKPSTDFFSQRMVVEECENIHLHYRNLRLEFSIDEFYIFAEKMQKAAEELQKGAELKKLPIEKVNPYNDTHPEGFENTDKEHREGIEKVKELIKKNVKILPILVRPVPGQEGTYQRYDGFKRYIAFKELGHKEIECLVSPKAKLGGQDGLPWEVTNG